MGHIYLFYFRVCFCVAEVLSPVTQRWDDPCFYVITNVFHFSVGVWLKVTLCNNKKWCGPLSDGSVPASGSVFAGCQGFFASQSVRCNNKTNWYLKQNRLVWSFVTLCVLAGSVGTFVTVEMSWPVTLRDQTLTDVCREAFQSLSLSSHSALDWWISPSEDRRRFYLPGQLPAAGRRWTFPPNDSAFEWAVGQLGFESCAH